MVQKPEIRDSEEGRAYLLKHQKNVTCYYELRGYNPATGRPTLARLTELDLTFVDEELSAISPDPWDGPTMWKIDEYLTGLKRV